MANTLTDLIPDLYAALDVVSRELTGMTTAVTMNASNMRAAVGQSVVVPITGSANISDITPSMTSPEPTDQTVTNVPIIITKARAAEFGFVGEEQKGLETGPGYMSIQANMIAQAMRGIANEVERDLTSMYLKTSRAYGTAGALAFDGDLSDSAQLLKILLDNGATSLDKQLVIDTSNGASMRSNTNLTKANEANDDTLLRQGVLLDVHGFAIRETGQAQSHTAGTGAGYLVNGAHVVGDTVIAVDTGTGTVLAGDVITIAGDSNKYVVAVALSGGNITIAAPGLVQDAASTSAVTLTADYTASIAFDRSAIQLVARPPATPIEGDMALDRMIITDPRSGLSFEVSIYPGYRKVRYELALAWGFENIKPEHTALLIS
jgi:hypothetical protein